MSTNHITEEINVGLVAAHALKAKNDAERQRLLDDKAAADQKLVDDLEAAAALARATQQQHEDESETRDHALAQANRVAGASPAPALEPQAPSDPAPAPVVTDPDAAGNQPTSVTPTVNPQPEPQASVRSFVRLPQTRLQWLLALIGAIIGAVIARFTYDPMWSNVSNDVIHTILVVLWFLALMVAMFFSGGMFGALIEEQDNANTPPTAA